MRKQVNGRKSQGTPCKTAQSSRPKRPHPAQGSLAHGAESRLSLSIRRTSGHRLCGGLLPHPHSLERLISLLIEADVGDLPIVESKEQRTSGEHLHATPTAGATDVR